VFLAGRPFVNTETLKQLLRKSDAIGDAVVRGETPVSAYIDAVAAWKQAVYESHPK
jgi:hypothetical protein